VRKYFPGHGTFEGQVVSESDRSIFRVHYEDGDLELLTRKELDTILVTETKIKSSDGENIKTRKEILNSDQRIDECDFVIVALPLGVLKGLHPASTVAWSPPLPDRKLEAFRRIGYGAENKIILRFVDVFWEVDKPYLQTTDERFRILNGLCFGKGNTLVFHCSPPFGRGYNGLDNDGVVKEAMDALRGMYGAATVPSFPDTSFVTRWDTDPFSMGAYSYWASGMTIQHVRDSAAPEPQMRAGGKGNLSKPRLFFCGEHTTVRDAQCVHGACNSGERAGRQVAAAALGFLNELDECIQAGENYWYTPSFSSGSVPGDSVRKSGFNVDVEQTIASVKGTGVNVSGAELLRSPRFSPFPTPEAVKWHQRERWIFRCLCGLKGVNFDDGSPMVACDECGVWQHDACVARYELPYNEEEDDENSADRHHACHRCDPDRYSICPETDTAATDLDADSLFESHTGSINDSDSSGVTREWTELVESLRVANILMSSAAQQAMSAEWNVTQARMKTPIDKSSSPDEVGVLQDQNP